MVSDMNVRSILLAVISAVLLTLSLPNELLPYGSFPIGLIALGPLFLALYLAPSYRFASVLGMVFGAVSTAMTSYWLWFFQDFKIWTLGGVVLGYVGYNALLAPILAALTRTKPAYRPFILAAAWAGYEYLKSSGFLGYPWGLIAYPAVNILPLVQFVEITGIWGLSLLMALSNALFAETLIRIGGFAPAPLRLGARKTPYLAPLRLDSRFHTVETRSRTSPASGSAHPDTGAPSFASALVLQPAFGCLLFLAAALYGAFRMAVPIPYRQTLTVALVQQNTDPWEDGNEVAALETALRLSEQALESAGPRPDLVVWSENGLSRPYLEYPGWYLRNPRSVPFVPFIRRHGVPFLVGTPVLVDEESASWMNATILLDGTAEPVDTYGKQHPVPFAESVPFWEYEAVRNFYHNVIGLYGIWTIGNRYTLYTVPAADGDVTFGTPICFEDAFPYLNREFVRRGADLLVNLTNDSWSKTVSAETQHFVVALLRAVENRRVLIRSTNAGVTAVIDPWGRTVASLPLFTEGVLVEKVPVYKETALTPYTLFGDYLPYLLFVTLVAALLFRNAFFLPGLFPERRRKPVSARNERERLPVS
jgi:apolipoprotein N-acyltransferase